MSEEAILRVVRNGKACTVAETADFIEKMFQYENFIVLVDTCDYKYMLLEFKDESDAEEFYSIIDELSDVLAKHFDRAGAPFFWNKQGEFIMALMSFFDDARIICCGKRLSEKYEGEVEGLRVF
jgi:hypothetical protein